MVGMICGRCKLSETETDSEKVAYEEERDGDEVRYAR